MLWAARISHVSFVWRSEIVARPAGLVSTLFGIFAHMHASVANTKSRAGVAVSPPARKITLFFVDAILSLRSFNLTTHRRAHSYAFRMRKKYPRNRTIKRHSILLGGGCASPHIDSASALETPACVHYNNVINLCQKCAHTNGKVGLPARWRDRWIVVCCTKRYCVLDSDTVWCVHVMGHRCLTSNANDKAAEYASFFISLMSYLLFRIYWICASANILSSKFD